MALATPALVCELDDLMDNVAKMASRVGAAGAALRPHVKSHKSAFIAKCQLDAGAAGLAFAKLSEAEVIVGRLLSDGHDQRVSALLTSPLVGAASARRAALLAERCDLLVAVDHVDGVDELVSALDEVGSRASVVCDVDVGLARTGVTDAASALEIAQRVGERPSLSFAGVQGYGGHLQHIVGREERREATKEANDRLAHVIDVLEGAGFAVGLRTGGGTGTCDIDIELGLLNELQPGSYVFMDREYRDALANDVEGDFHQSLVLATKVISANHRDFVTVDAGLKAMATDAGVPTVVGHETGSSYHFFGDEQGLITQPESKRFSRGDVVYLVPPHCDPTVDRHDVIWLVRGDVVLGALRVDARGCSQ